MLTNMPVLGTVHATLVVPAGIFAAVAHRVFPVWSGALDDQGRVLPTRICTFWRATAPCKQNRSVGSGERVPWSRKAKCYGFHGVRAQNPHLHRLHAPRKDKRTWAPIHPPSVVMTTLPTERGMSPALVYLRNFSVMDDERSYVAGTLWTICLDCHRDQHRGLAALCMGAHHQGLLAA